MNAVQIIEEIQQLPPEEKARVMGFVRALDRPRKLSSEDLNKLAEKLVVARTEEDAATLKEQITAGFYGE